MGLTLPTTTVPIEAQGNPLYPLPKNYAEISDPNVRRLARINACRQSGSAEAARAAWAFFVSYYLKPGTDHDPGFFKNVLETPPAHYWIADWIDRFRFLAVGAPRGFAKSTLKRSFILHRSLCWPGTDIVTVLSKEDFGIDEMDRLKLQFEQNERILEDFGELRTGRGSAGIWNNHQLGLSSRSVIRMFSIDGKIRSVRPDWLFLDDPEHDDDYKSRARLTTAALTEKLLKILGPALEAKSHVAYFNTILSKQSFGHLLICTEDDERFRSISNGGLWFKANIPAVDSAGRNAFPAKYTESFLSEKRRLMGDSFFRTEYMGDPRSEEEAPFNLLPDLHEAELSQEDARIYAEAPWMCRGDISYKEVGEKPGEGSTVATVRKPIQQWLNGMTRVVAVDYGGGLTAAHDFSAVLVGGLDSRNCLWVLDGWHGRRRSTELAKMAWDLAVKWRVSQIGVEAVGAQEEVVRLVRLHGQTVMEARDGSWCPSVVPLKYTGRLDKGDRIANALEWRFNQGAFKLLRNFRDSHPTIRELYHQIRHFTPDLRNLQHDDVIDAAAMLQLIFKSATLRNAPTAQPQTAVELMLSGQMTIPGTNIPIMGGIPLQSLPVGLLDRIMAAGEKSRQEAAWRSEYTDVPDEIPPMPWSGDVQPLL